MNNNDDYISNIKILIENALKTKKPFIESKHKNIQELLEELNIFYQELEFQNEELKRIRENLEISNKQYEDLYNNAPVAYVTYKSTYEIISINKKFCELINNNENNCTNFLITNFIAPESQDTFYFHINNILRYKKSENCQIKILTAKKDIIPVIVESNFFEKDNDFIIRSAFIDISKEKRYESEIRDINNELAKKNLELKDYKDRLDASMLAGNMAWWQMNVITGEVIFNELKTKILGYEAKNFNHWTHFTDIIHPDDYEHTMEEMKKLLEGKSNLYNVDYRIKTKNGDYKWFMDIGKISSTDEKGNPLLVTGVAIDITDRKKSEKMLKENEEKLRIITENIEEVIWLRSKDNKKILYINPAYERIWGKSCQSLYDNPDSFMDNVYEEDKEIVNKEFQEYLKTGNFNLKYRIVNANNQIRWVRAKSFIIKDKNGEIIGYTGTAVDITELIEYEEKLINATKAKSIFLANMSHEIRTPLNVIINMSKLLNETQLDSKQKDYLDTILKSSEILLSLVNDILDFSKIEAGKMNIENIDFDLNKIIDNCYKMLKPKATEKGLNFNISLNYNIDFYLNGDSNKLNQILLNLLSNSIKFTNFGEINLTISCIEEKDDYITLKFEVTDTGIGISKEKMKDIFTPFSQGDNSITRKYGGTGLGLSITKKLIDLMNGEIYIESIEHKGTKIWFILKFLKKNKITSNNVSKLIAEIEKFNNLKVLIAEDNLLNQKVANLLFNKLGIKPDFANNGLEVFNLINKNNYNIIFLDIEMPELDGIETAKMLRKDNINIPIIAMTAHVIEEYKNKILESGMNDIITKPINIENIVKVIKKLKIEPDNENQNLNSIDKEIFDKNEFLLRLNNDLTFYKEMIDLTIDEIPKKLNEIRDAYNNNDLELLQKKSHSFKGIALNINAKKLSNILLEIEICSKNKDMDKIKQIFSEFENQTKILLEILQREKKNFSQLNL